VYAHLRLTQSPYFEAACTRAFHEVDMDQDGQLDFKEFYIAVLRLYDFLNEKLPCHLKIPSTNQMKDMMAKHDKDCSGHLSFEEFLSMCKEMAGGNGKFRDSLLFKATIVLGIKLVALPLAGKVLGTKINISALPPVVTQQAIQMGLGQAVKQFNVPLPL